MDLLKVFPDLRRMLGATLDVPIWTLSGTTHGRLNCPVSWNTNRGTLSSFLWLEKPNLQRDKNGWVNIGGYLCNEAETEGTWLEWLRDSWAHGQEWQLLPSEVSFSAVDYNRCFYPIMSHWRGWFDEPRIEHAYRMAAIWLMKANRRFARAVEKYRLGCKEYPYFAPESIPGFNAPRIPLLPLEAVITSSREGPSA
jgi:hypothetical protein